MYSIENLPESLSPHLVLTPRSQEALKRSGYRLCDLNKKSPQEIHDLYNDNETSKAILEKRMEH